VRRDDAEVLGEQPARLAASFGKTRTPSARHDSAIANADWIVERLSLRRFRVVAGVSGVEGGENRGDLAGVAESERCGVGGDGENRLEVDIDTLRSSS
jgi:hypothetical protein